MRATEALESDRFLNPPQATLYHNESRNSRLLEGQGPPAYTTRLPRKP